MKTWTLAGIALLTLLAPANADIPAATVEQIDQAVRKHMEVANLPGVLVEVHIPGQGDYVKAFGLANLETKTPRNTTDPFRIASITKTFTATAILQLVDQGKLKTSDPISRWFPDFPQADKITVNDLLLMRSGIADYTSDAFMENYYRNPLQSVTADDLIALSAAQSDKFSPPGQATHYTNLNYVLLEQIVEKASGQSTQDFMSTHIFQPLGMNDTFYATAPELPPALRGYSYDATTGLFVDRTELNPNPAGGAGAIVSTSADLHVYAKALATGQLLSQATQQERLKTFPFGAESSMFRYGQGIAKLGDFWGHNGTIFGFSSEMFYLPEQDATIVINVNRLDLDDQSKSSQLFFILSTLLFPEASPWAEDARKLMNTQGL